MACVPSGRLVGRKDHPGESMFRRNILCLLFTLRPMGRADDGCSVLPMRCRYATWDANPGESFFP
jgi:hypothetical protein